MEEREERKAEEKIMKKCKFIKFLDSLEKTILLLVIVVVAACSNNYMQKFKRVNMDLPPVTPSIRVIPNDVKNDPRIVINPLINSKTKELLVPKSIEQSIDEIRLMLPEKTYLALMSLYIDGLSYESLGDSYSESLRYRLSKYLYENWIISESKIANSLRCMGAFEGNLSFLFILEAKRYAKKNGLSLFQDIFDYSNELKTLQKECE